MYVCVILPQNQFLELPHACHETQPSKHAASSATSSDIRSIQLWAQCLDAQTFYNFRVADVLLNMCVIYSCLLFFRPLVSGSLSNTSRSYGLHRRYLCAIAAACAWFGVMHCCIPSSHGASAPWLSVVYKDYSCVGGRSQAAVQAQRLRLLTFAALNMMLLQKLVHRRYQCASRRDSLAMLLRLIKRSCGGRLVMSCIDCAIRARVSNEFRRE